MVCGQAVTAQPTQRYEYAVGTCDPGTADAYLDVGDVRARIPMGNGLFYRGEPHVYQVPRTDPSEPNAVFAAALNLAGFADDTLRIMGGRYVGGELWPGPIPPGGAAPAGCHAYDRLYSVYASDVERYERAGIAARDLADWPYLLGAPVIDGDGVPGNYDLAAGDRPGILGQQTIWTVMNDRGNVHRLTDGLPLGVEVRRTAVAFGLEPAGVYSPPAIRQTTLYRFEVTNRTSHHIRDFWWGLYVDVDLGDFTDDYVGTDTVRNILYFYNADDYDESSEGYGAPPPAIGFTVVKGPKRQATSDGGSCTNAAAEERLGLEASTYGDWYRCTDPPDGEACTWPYVMYRSLQGLDADGAPVTAGGEYGGESEEPTRYWFPGDPVEMDYWSELNIDGNGAASRPGDRLAYMGIGPTCLPPGETDELVVAVVWARGTDHLDSVRRLRSVTDAVHATKGWLLAPQPRAASGPPTTPPVSNAVSVPYPNPSSHMAEFLITAADEAPLTLQILDPLGRIVREVQRPAEPPGEWTERIRIADLAPGMYLWRANIGRAHATGTLVVVH